MLAFENIKAEMTKFCLHNFHVIVLVHISQLSTLSAIFFFLFQDG